MTKVDVKKGATIEAATIGNQSLRSATIVATIITFAACLIPMAPAVMVNLDNTSSVGNAWTVFAVASVVFGALCIDLAFETKGLFKRLLLCVLALIFVGMNVLNAVSNVSAGSEGSRNDRRNLIERKSASLQSLQSLQKRREAQANVIGERAVANIEAEMQFAKAEDSKRWQSTENCNPDKITAAPSRELCKRLAALDEKRSAALERDKIDREIAALPKFDGTAPKSADPYAESLARFLGLFGYGMNDEGKALIGSSRDWLKAVLVELLAGFGPWVVGLMKVRLTGRKAVANPQHPGLLEKKGRKTTEGKTSSSVPIPAQKQEPWPVGWEPELAAFLARRVDFEAGSYVKASDLYQAWCEDCEDYGRLPGSQKAFTTQIKKKIVHEPNNCRPRYAGIKLKERPGPVLRIVNGMNKREGEKIMNDLAILHEGKRMNRMRARKEARKRIDTGRGAEG